MFRFEHPLFLWGLAALPLLVLAYRWAMHRKRRALDTLGQRPLMVRLLPEYDARRQHLKFGLWLGAVALLLIAAANPQRGTTRQRVQRESVDVVLALDISLSMLAQDLPPNRLERAKRLGDQLVDALRGNRIGLIVFAGNAYLQMPLTTDYAASRLFVQSSTTRQAPAQGTAIKEAITLASEAYAREAKYQRALVIITDGEDHEKGVEEAASAALADGIQVFTVGVGTATGARIPLADEELGQYKKDDAGQEVITALNEPMLRSVAKAGGGNYYTLTPDNEAAVVKDLVQRLEQLEKQSFEQRSYEEYASYYAPFLGLAMLLILMEFMLPDARKSQRFWGDLWRG